MRQDDWFLLLTTFYLEDYLGLQDIDGSLCFNKGVILFFEEYFRYRVICAHQNHFSGSDEPVIIGSTW